jgi:hypothetical protein
MMEVYFPTAFIGALVIFFLLSLGVLIVLRIALHFSLFGIKDLIKECIKEQREIKEILKTIAEKDRTEEVREPDE